MVLLQIASCSRLLAKFDWVVGNLQKIWLYSDKYYQKMPDRPLLQGYMRH